MPNIEVIKLALEFKDHPDVELDLTKGLEEVKKQCLVIKEGTQYRIKIYFNIQDEIVSGLRYFQNCFRKGVQVDKSNYMVGSFGPQPEPNVWVSPFEDAPTGMLTRGKYSVESRFTDDDKNVYLEWEWNYELKPDWETNPSDMKNVEVVKFALEFEGRPDAELDLTKDLAETKNQPLVIKEGTRYRKKIYFYIRDEIVTGLKYLHKVSRKGIKVNNETFMVGSYGPKEEPQVWMSPEEEAPSGMLMRGDYIVDNTLTDDDKNIYLQWESTFSIKTDWE